MLQNVKFEFVNTTDFTHIVEVSDIPNVNSAAPELRDYLVMGTCVGADINQHYSCILCSKKVDNSTFTGNTAICPNCQITTSVSSLKTKDKLTIYTAFNDAVQSFLANIKCDTTLQDVDAKVLTQQLLNTGPQKMIADKSTKITSQFLQP